MATRPEFNILEAYRAYAQVFYEADSESMPSHSPQDLAIELHDGKDLLCGPIYNMYFTILF